MQCKKKKFLVLFVDAVNEYNSASVSGPRPVNFLQKLDGIIWSLAQHYPGIKVVVTCRPETWKGGTALAKTDFIIHASAYFSGPNELAHSINRFTEEESRQAYENYRREQGISTEYNSLSALAQYHFRDPLLLSLAAKGLRRAPDSAKLGNWQELI